MLLFRNRELRVFLFVYLLFSVAAAAAAALISVWAVALVTVVCGASAFLFVLFTKRRYQAIAELSSQIDGLLHGDYHTAFIPDEEGELAVLRSELSKMTLRLREQAEHLEQDKRFLSDSLADISHQLRTPLTSIRLLVSRLARKDQSAAQQQESLQKVELLLDRTQWLISALLKIAKLGSGTVQFAEEPILIKDLVTDALRPLELLMDIKGLQLSCRIPSHVRFIGDRLWTAEAMGNVLKNCVEHCAEGGKLELLASENPIYTEILVQDNGAGFAEKDIPHLFERFYRGSNAEKESAGIGLNLSRMIVSAQNGVITAANRASGGARFTIRFYKGAG